MKETKPEEKGEIKAVDPDTILEELGGCGNKATKHAFAVMKETKPEDREEMKALDPDKMLEELGGCGKYQIRMAVIVHLIKTIVCFTNSNLILSTKTPSWFCVNDSVINMTYYTECKDSFNVPGVFCRKQECYINDKECENIVFDNSLRTIVDEFNLICDQDFIPSLINSIQVAGIVVGNAISGQLADLYGRKPCFFASIMIILVSHVAGYFSITWQMFTVCSFFGGVGGGFFNTVQFCLLSEFTLAKWRAWITGFPSWPLQGCLFALFGWLLHDWRLFQLMTAIAAVPCLLSWFVIPESFRWYIAHDNQEKAMAIINDIAKCNKKLDFKVGSFEWTQGCTDKKKYTFIDLFKSHFLARVTLLLMLNWVAFGVVQYGISFGIQTLSGNIYLNLFLFSVVGIPSRGMSIWLQNRFGRRKSTLICFIVVAIGALIAGIVQTLDISSKDEITNIFALIANIGVSTAWAPVQTMTIELYPTVIRNIGFGTLSFVGRIGAIAGPQLVYLDSFLPGLLFYICGGISVLCILGTCFLPETKDANLNDKLKTSDPGLL